MYNIYSVLYKHIYIYICICKYVNIYIYYIDVYIVLNRCLKDCQ